MIVRSKAIKGLPDASIEVNDEGLFVRTSCNVCPACCAANWGCWEEEDDVDEITARAKTDSRPSFRGDTIITDEDISMSFGLSRSMTDDESRVLIEYLAVLINESRREYQEAKQKSGSREPNPDCYLFL